MANSITFNGVSSKDFEIRLRSVNRPTIPQRTDRMVTVAGMDGYYNFAGEYGTREIVMECSVVGSSFPDLWARLRKVSAWLKTKDFAKLTIDDETDRYYLAKVTGEVSPELAEYMPIATFEVTFTCQPFAYSALPFLKYGQQVFLSDSMLLSSDVYLGYVYDDKLFPHISGKAVLEIQNDGFPINPTLVITGSFTTLSISANGQTLNYVEALSGKTLIIDLDKRTATIDGVNKLNKLTGYFQIQKGTNTITVDGTGMNFDLEIKNLNLKML